MSLPAWVPSQRFLVLGGADWLMVAIGFVVAEAGPPAVRIGLATVGAVVAGMGILRERFEPSPQLT